MILVLTADPRILRQSESSPGEPGADGRRSPRLMGASISALRQLHALAAAPFVERLLLYSPKAAREAATRLVEGSPFAGRVEVLDEGGLGRSLAKGPAAVLVDFGADLLRPQLVRWACGGPRWPVCGFAYSVSPTGVFRSLALSAISGLQPYDSIFCCSRSVRDALGRMLDAISTRVPDLVRPRLPVVPLGIRAGDFEPLARDEARRALALPEDAPVFLYLGRIDPRYKANLQPLLTAFAGLGGAGGALLVVAGADAGAGGPHVLERLRFRAAELGVAERVRWLTNVSASVRRELLSAADVFVSPADNLQESFGLSVIEAMCAGLPVVASDWNGYRDVVEHDRTGLLVPTRYPLDLSAPSRRAGLVPELDFHWEMAEATIVDVAALGAAMGRLAGDPDLRRRMGSAGQERARARFDWERVLALSRKEWEAQLEAAGEAGTSPPPPLALDYGEVFSTHVTERLSAALVVRTTAGADVPSVVVSLPPPFFDGALLQSILAAAKRPTPLERLPGAPATAARHAAYLLKHGLLEIVGGSADRPRRGRARRRRTGEARGKRPNRHRRGAR
jgi:glycosyltransferase involved in cell wall biosynthesis